MAPDRRRVAADLVAQHGAAVYALCRAMVRDDQLAEDLSQDAFARAFGALDEFRGEASPRTWLLAIARNRCLDHLARVKRAPWQDEPEPDEHPSDHRDVLSLLADRDDAERALSVLDETSRALVVLHFGHGVDYRDLAHAFDLREGTLRMRISRSLARMRDALLPPPDDDLEHEVAAERSIARGATDELALDLDFAEEVPTGQIARPPLYEHLPQRLVTRLHALAAAL